MFIPAGTTFGRWTVISSTEAVNRTCIPCVCSCGMPGTPRFEFLKRGRSQSCGCFALEGRTTHGRSGDPVLAVYISMRQRCSNPNAQNYHRYGGRGITVCDRWLDKKNGFLSFISDLGERPPGTTIERVNNDFGYSPENCKWSTRKEQYANRSTNHYIEFNGERRTITEWAAKIGIATPNLIARLNKLKWPLERALTEPPNKKFSHKK